MSNKNLTSYHRVFGNNMHTELKEPPATSFANQLPKSGQIYNANATSFNRLFEKNVNSGSNVPPDNVNACQFPDIGQTYRTISSPIFASATFPKYVPNKFNSNMWTTIFQPSVFGQEPVKTQNERDISVHALPVPLSKHYKNYEEPRFNYHLEIQRGVPNLMVTSTPIGKRVNAFNYKSNKYNDTSKSTQTEFILAETTERGNSAGLSLNPALCDINMKIHTSGILITYNDQLNKPLNNCEPRFNFHDAIQNNDSQDKVFEPKTDKSKSIKISQNSVSSTSQYPRKIDTENNVPKISELTDTFRTNLDISGPKNIQELDCITTQNQPQKFTANLEPRKPLFIQKTDYIPKLCQELQFTDSNLKTMKLTSNQNVDYVPEVCKQTQVSDSKLESKNSQNIQNAGYIPKVSKELQYPNSNLETKKSSFRQNIDIPEASNKLQIPKSKEMNNSPANQKIASTPKIFKELDTNKTDAELKDRSISKVSTSQNMPSIFDPDNTTEDLRLLLNARKHSNAQISDETDKKTTLEEPLPRKKRVSFKEDSIEDVIDAPQDVLQIQVNSTNNQSHQLLERNGSNLSQNFRYILVDLDLLFENLDVIVDLVKKDEENRLFIPRSMSQVVESISLGDSRGRPNVLLARKLYRIITFPPPRVVGKTFLVIYSQDVGEVYISNDKTTQKRATTYKIPCYTLSGVSNDILPTALQPSCDNHSLSCNIYDFNSNLAYEEQTEIQTGVIKVKKLSSASSGSKKIVLDDENKEIKISFSNDKLDANQNVLGNNQNEINNKENVDTSQDLIKKQHEGDNNHIDVESSVSSVFFVDKSRNKISKTKTILTLKNSKPFMDLKRFDATANSNANVDEFNKDNKLGVRENDLNNVKDAKNLPNCDKLIRSFKIPKMKMWSLDDNLMRFVVEGDEVGEKIVTRIEEWMCSLRQVMEETLKDILKDVRAMEKLSRIGNIYECLECILIGYKDHNKIKIITGKLLQLLRENILKNGLFCNEPLYFSGKLNPNIKSDDFMKIMGCSILLIEQLKLLHTNNYQLVDAEFSLHNILESLMKNEPVTIVSPSKTTSTVASGCKSARRNYTKELSQIQTYIDKHFNQTSSQKEALEERCDLIRANKEKPKTFRTLGKNVSTVKIDNKNSMTLENAKDNLNAESAEKIPKKSIIIHSNVEIITNKKVVNDGNEEPFENMVIDEPNDKYYDTKFKISNNISSTTNVLDDIDIEDSGNTFGTKENGPKVLRNIKLLDSYENKFKQNQLLNKENKSKYFETDNANNNKSNEKTLNDSAFFNESKTSVDCVVSSNNRSKIIFPLQKSGIENSCTSLNIKNNNNNNLTDDSGYSNETYKHNPLKMLIHNLNLVFSSVLKFVDNTVIQIREEKLTENGRYDLNYKTGQCEEQLEFIIEDLKKIIQRESNEDNSNSLQSIMRKETNTQDKFSAYMENIQKCLRNATLLRDTLKLMYNPINGDYESLSPMSV
ncbi:hypothetical protein K1T71_000910 [Dendrolimus kikuchii]|uniref:Uncharacterized protein n=1 Tax=Dendrolimus kikuchii TaxID=765133 RepID=A0ACC1DGP9_9NEOP|nr:hypothetical protein K1T71_000910 [Dendrolimus kikuchii]